jgi:hypothetical protein
MNCWTFGPESGASQSRATLPSKAESDGQLDPRSLTVQSVGVFIGSRSFIAGKLPWSFGEGDDVAQGIFVIWATTLLLTASNSQDKMPTPSIEDVLKGKATITQSYQTTTCRPNRQNGPLHVPAPTAQLGVPVGRPLPP